MLFFSLLHRIGIGWGRRWAKTKDAFIHWSVVRQGSVVIEIGAHANIGSRTILNGVPGSVIRIGKRSWIGSYCEISSLDEVCIGAFTSIQHRSQIHGQVKIGSGCICAADMYISSSEHEFRRQPSQPIRMQDRGNAIENRLNSRPVVIGDDCWIGIRVAVMPGVEIGRGCIVGANSVVTKSLPPYSVAAGCPARVIRQRFEFCPPSKLDASNESHLPYFYEGFLIFSESEEVVAPSRLNGGFEAVDNFGVACNLDGVTQIVLEVFAESELILIHGDNKIHISAGISKLQISPTADARGILCFKKLCMSGLSSKSRLSILTVSSVK